MTENNVLERSKSKDNFIQCSHNAKICLHNTCVRCCRLCGSKTRPHGLPKLKPTDNEVLTGHHVIDMNAVHDENSLNYSAFGEPIETAKSCDLQNMLKIFGMSADVEGLIGTREARDSNDKKLLSEANINAMVITLKKMLLQTASVLYPGNPEQLLFNTISKFPKFSGSPPESRLRDMMLDLSFSLKKESRERRTVQAILSEAYPECQLRKETMIHGGESIEGSALTNARKDYLTLVTKNRLGEIQANDTANVSESEPYDDIVEEPGDSPQTSIDDCEEDTHSANKHQEVEQRSRKRKRMDRKYTEILQRGISKDDLKAKAAYEFLKAAVPNFENDPNFPEIQQVEKKVQNLRRGIKRANA